MGFLSQFKGQQSSQLDNVVRQAQSLADQNGGAQAVIDQLANSGAICTMPSGKQIAGITGLQQSVTNGFAGVQQSLCSGFAGVNQGMSSGFNQTQVTMLQGFNALQAQQAQCCCDQQLAMANQTAALLAEHCADRQALNDGVQRVLDKMCDQELQAERRENDNLRQQINMMNLAASQNQQTQQLLAAPTYQGGEDGHSEPIP